MLPLAGVERSLYLLPLLEYHHLPICRMLSVQVWRVVYTGINSRSYQLSAGSPFLLPDKYRKFLRFFVINIIIIIIITSFIFQFRRDFSVLRKQIFIKFISLGSYFPKVHACGTLIMSTKVFRLIICKTL